MSLMIVMWFGNHVVTRGKKLCKNGVQEKNCYGMRMFCDT